MGLAHSEGGGKLTKTHLADVTRNTENFRNALIEQEAIFKNSQLGARMN
jgi:hypothetical protein